MHLIPLYTFIKRHSRAPKDIQRTANREIHLALATGVNFFQVLETACPSCIGDRNSAPLGQLRDQFFIDTLLQAFNVGSMNEEFGAVGF